jgi:ubiquitin-like 1-activating enzyme E1 B
MAGNIIPAIATTNAMTASLCVLQGFKVLREELSKAKMVFLAPNGTERRMTTEALSPPNPECAICSVAQTTLEVDISRATLNDLVEGVLRLQLGYGEEFRINKDNIILYDPEEDTHLSKTFSDLGLKNDSSVTIIDEADEEAKVNLVLHIAAKDMGQDTEPIHLTKKITIPSQPAKAANAAPEANGHAHPATNGTTNGTTNGATNGMVNGKRKRPADEAELEVELVKKKGKVATAPDDDDDVVLVDDSSNGAIVIDDD